MEPLGYMEALVPVEDGYSLSESPYVARELGDLQTCSGPMYATGAYTALSLPRFCGNPAQRPKRLKGGTKNPMQENTEPNN